MKKRSFSAAPFGKVSKCKALYTALLVKGVHVLVSVTEDGTGEVSLLKGDTVVVVGASPRRGHLVVEHSNHSLHVPFQFLELKPSAISI